MNKPKLAPNNLLKEFKLKATLFFNYLKNDWKHNLKSHGVKLCKFNKKSPTKNSLVLLWIYFCSKQNYKTNQEQLQNLIKEYRLNAGEVSGIQRGLYGQGWEIYSGKRGNDINNDYDLKTSEYFIDITKPNERFSIERRDTKGLDWEAIKKIYDYRCATCGSKEGEKIFNDNRKCVLQMGHMDPAGSMDSSNIIPQCQRCNEQYQNKWVFDKKGRVIGIGSADAIDKHTSDKIKKDILNKLSKEKH